MKKRPIPIIALFILFLLLLSNCSKPLDDAQLHEKSRILHKKLFTIDTHCDTPLRMVDSEWDIGVKHDNKSYRRNKIDLPRMIEGGMDVQFFAAYVGQRERIPENYSWARKRADELIDAVLDMCEKHSNVIAFATNPKQAYRNSHNGLLTAFIGIENGFPLGKNLENIAYFYNRGTRYITLCHVTNNDICDSSTDPKGPEHHGLSEFGYKVVQEMNQLGMIIDVSHISDEAFFDVIEASKAPVIASHSCTRALCNHPRNLSDEMILALAENGGVLQMCFFSGYVIEEKPNTEKDAELSALNNKYGSWDDIDSKETKEMYRREYYSIQDKYLDEKASVSDLVDHIDHTVKLVGIEHVGIGTDFDGGGGLSDCNDVSEMSNVTFELIKRGYSKRDIAKIWGKNFMHVFREVIKISERQKS